MSIINSTIRPVLNIFISLTIAWSKDADPKSQRGRNPTTWNSKKQNANPPWLPIFGSLVCLYRRHILCRKKKKKPTSFAKEDYYRYPKLVLYDSFVDWIIAVTISGPKTCWVQPFHFWIHPCGSLMDQSLHTLLYLPFITNNVIIPHKKRLQFWQVHTRNDNCMKSFDYRIKWLNRVY